MFPASLSMAAIGLRAATPFGAGYLRLNAHGLEDVMWAS